MPTECPNCPHGWIQPDVGGGRFNPKMVYECTKCSTSAQKCISCDSIVFEGTIYSVDRTADPRDPEQTKGVAICSGCSIEDTRYDSRTIHSTTDFSS